MSEEMTSDQKVGAAGLALGAVAMVVLVAVANRMGDSSRAFDAVKQCDEAVVCVGAFARMKDGSIFHVRNLQEVSYVREKRADVEKILRKGEDGWRTAAIEHAEQFGGKR